MGFGDVLQKKSSGGFGSVLQKKSTGGFGSVFGKKTKNYSIGSIEELKSVAIQFGVETKEKKPSFFQRSIDLISRPLYASAGAAKAIVKKENVFEEAKKGLFGQEKETYSDVLAEMGIKNKYIKGGVGFALDVVLDPTTYFGGTIIKGVAKGVGKGAKIAGKGYSKVAPTSALHLEAAGKNLKEAFGHAFVYGYGTTKGLGDDVARTINKMGIAKDDVIAGNIKTFGKYSKSELSEAGEIMMKNRRIELGIRKGTKTDYILSPNKKVAELVAVMKNKGAEMAKKAGLDPEKAYANYIPFLRKDKLKGVSQASGILKKGAEGYRKEFKDLIKDDNLLKKPIEAYSRREYEVVRDGIVKQSLDDLVKAYGKGAKAFKNADEALQAGYKPIYERGFKQMTAFPVKTVAGKTVRAIGKPKAPLGYLKEADAKFIDNYLFPEFKTIDILAKASGYDKFTRWFKTWVTAYFPAFHIRNYISGNVQNYQVLGKEAFNPQNHHTALGILRGGKKSVPVKIGKYVGSTGDLNKVMKENFLGSSRYISDIGDYIDEIVGATNKFKIKKIGNMRQIGNLVELNQKAVAMTGALRQGKTMKEAVKLAEKAGFDYTKITKFESKVMRRLIPFYTFARKNAELQLTTIAKHPERIVNQVKFARNLSEVFGGKPTEEDLKGLPEWALSGLGFKVSGNRYLTKFGLPLEEFIERINEPGKSTISSMNPIIKYPLEAKMGWDFFREKKITDVNKIAPVTGEILLSDKTPQFIKDIMNVKKVETEYGTKYYGSPKNLHTLRNLPTSRFQNTLEKMFDNDMDKVDKWLAFLTGARIYDIDIEQQRWFQERDLRRDIEDELLQQGVGREFESFYIPK